MTNAFAAAASSSKNVMESEQNAQVLDIIDRFSASLERRTHGQVEIDILHVEKRESDIGFTLVAELNMGLSCSPHDQKIWLTQKMAGPTLAGLSISYGTIDSSMEFSRYDYRMGRRGYHQHLLFFDKHEDKRFRKISKTHLPTGRFRTSEEFIDFVVGQIIEYYH
jgi:hypothetical protein